MTDCRAWLALAILEGISSLTYSEMPAKSCCHYIITIAPYTQALKFPLSISD